METITDSKIGQTRGENKIPHGGNVSFKTPELMKNLDEKYLGQTHPELKEMIKNPEVSVCGFMDWFAKTYPNQNIDSLGFSNNEIEKTLETELGNHTISSYPNPKDVYKNTFVSLMLNKKCFFEWV
jgi:hypothetical protein